MTEHTLLPDTGASDAVRPPPSRRILLLVLALPAVLAATPAAAAPVTLERLIDTTVDQHPAVLAQRAQGEAARAEVEAARWQYYPTPAISVERAGGSADPYYRGDATVSVLSLRQPLWTGGRLRAAVERAEAGVEASAGAADEVRQQLALRVLQAYGDWLAAHLKWQAGETSLATHTRLRDQVTRRIAQGASSEADLVLAAGRLQAVTAELALAAAQRDIARGRLEQLAGFAMTHADLAAAPAAPRRVAGAADTLADAAVAAGPSTRKLAAQARGRAAAIAESRAELLPEIVLRAERQYGNHALRDSAPDNRLFIGVSSRFGAGLSSLSNVAARRAQYEAALADVEAERRAIREQVLSDLALARAAEARLAAFEASLGAARDVAASYDRQFLAGRKSWLDVMNAARELAQTEAQIADVRAAQVVATWRVAIYTTPSLSDLSLANPIGR